jgi:hypothetical protein
MDRRQVVSSVAVLAALLVIAVGLLFITGGSKQNNGSKVSPILAGTSTDGGDYHYTVNQPYYTVDVTYPSTLALPASVAEKAGEVMEKALSEDIAQYKHDANLDTLTPEDVQTQGLGVDRKYAFGASYELYQSTSTASYVFTIYEDTLGAHPNTFYQTFTFNQQGTLLTLADLFKPGAQYLPVLSKLAYAGVVAQLTEKTGTKPTSDMLDTARIGTEPSPEALQFFYLDKNVLHLLFPPYQVAAYAAGSFDVPIARATLSAIVR